MSSKLVLILISLLLLSSLLTATNSTRKKSKSKYKGNKRQEKQAAAAMQPVASRLVNLNEPEFDSLADPYIEMNTIQNTVNMSVMLGQNVILPCAVRNIASFKILWLRLKDGDVLAYDDMVITQDPRFTLIKKTLNESNLKIQSVKSTDSGEYACQINTQSLKAKLINLIIMTPPTFIDSDSVDSDATLGQYYTNAALAGTAPSNLITKHAAHLHHNHAHHQQQSRSHLNHESARTVNVLEGKQISLECNAFGIPKPDINWYVKRFQSNVLTEYLLNSSKLIVNNVTRDQYEYFECEATNKIPPSVSKKFKIDVHYPPEIKISPSKVYVSMRSSPVQVRINCTVNSFPESDVQWLFAHQNDKKYETRKIKKHRQTIQLNSASKKQRRTKSDEISPEDEINLENSLILTSKDKYSIYFQMINETSKMSSLVINVEDENDLGNYSCYANNSVGIKSAKFSIHKELEEPSTTTVSVLNKDAFINLKTLQNQNLNKKDLIIDDNYHLVSSTPAAFQIESTLINEFKETNKDASDLFKSLFKSNFTFSSSSSSSSSTSYSSYYIFNLNNCFLIFLINFSMMTIL